MESNLKTGILNVATAAARAAGNAISQNIEKLDRIKTAQKSANEFVSEIDQLAEELIIAEIEKHYPEHSILAEESGEKNKSDDICWVIDPIDGTHNFLHGNPHCCVSIAVKSKEQVEIAVVYDPFRNELFSASQGSGAQLDGRRIRVSDKKRLADSLLCTGFPGRAANEVRPWLKSFAALLPRAQSIHRTGSSVLDFAWLACGRYDGFWEFGMRDWDIAAGSLLVSEAGGLIADMNGSSDIFASGNVLAANPDVFKRLKHCIDESLS